MHLRPAVTPVLGLFQELLMMGPSHDVNVLDQTFTWTTRAGALGCSAYFNFASQL